MRDRRLSAVAAVDEHAGVDVAVRERADRDAASPGAAGTPAA